tara:strand:+ start:105 stop:323 length:219 start_codon:yes stop_codon:yes gene_type:complete
MFRLKKISLLLLLSLLSTLSFAQEITMADAMRESGKIYVVVAVLSLVMVGLLAYLIYIDKKVSKIESEIDKK